MDVGATLIARLLGWAVGVFKDVEAVGDAIPKGPVLVVANHPNSLLDPLIVFRIAGRRVRPLAKAPLFEQTGVGLVLRALGGLPVYRRQDDPALMDRNEDTFRDGVAALRAGEALQIFPEGTSHSHPSLQPLRTGAARIALRSEAEAGWTLGLVIVPVGLTYLRKTEFRGRAVAHVGEAFPVVAWRDRYETDPVAAARALTEEITRRLEAVTLNFAQADDVELVNTADRLYAREKGWAGWREREPLSERLPRLRVFTETLAWLRAHDPGRHARLERAVRRYHRRLALLHAGDADVPARYTPAAVARYVVREAAVLTLTLPLALVGMIAWALPYHLTRWVLRRMPPLEKDVVATYKLVLSMIAYPIFWAIWSVLALLLGGPGLGVITALALPPLGMLAIYWGTRWDWVLEDTKLFFRVAPDPQRRSRLAGDRKALVGEFDAVRRAMLESRGLPEEEAEGPGS